MSVAPSSSSGASAAGFTILELTLVLLIVLGLVVLGVPRVQGVVIENRSPSLARDVIKVSTRIIAARVGTSSTPYAGFNTPALSAALADTSFIVTGPSAIAHPLTRGTGTPSVTGTPFGGGQAFQITLNAVDQVGCMPFVTSVAEKSEWLSINGTVVRDSLATPPMDLSPSAAASNCSADTNLVVVQFR